jgi:hypothetical protein
MFPAKNKDGWTNDTALMKDVSFSYTMRLLLREGCKDCPPFGDTVWQHVATAVQNFTTSFGLSYLLYISANFSAITHGCKTITYVIRLLDATRGGTVG